MAFLWIYFYLIVTLSVLIVATYNGEVAKYCAVLLLCWFVMANVFYRNGEIETFSTIFIALIEIIFCGLVVKKHQHWLPLYLIGSWVTIILWSLIYTGPNPYTYKAIKNAIYIGALIAVLIECSHWRFIRVKG